MDDNKKKVKRIANQAAIASEAKQSKNRTEKRSMAQSLFLKGISQKEIAEIISISEQTISKWRAKFEWDNLREIETITRSSLLKQAYIQLAAVNKEIEGNNNIPTKVNSDSKAQLLREIEHLSEIPIHKYIEVFQEVISWLSRTDPKHIKEFSEVTWRFVEAQQSLNGN